MNSNEVQKSTEPIYLSIIIPAFNEEKRIGNTLWKIDNYLKAQAYTSEIILVDDGSTDGTVAIVTELIDRIETLRIVKNGENRGKGYSVKNGFMNARGKFLLFSDADLATPIKETEMMLKIMESGYDLALGSRGLKESDIKIHQPWYREIMGTVFNLLVRALAVKGFKDTQCGFKCFTREAAIQICKKQRIERFSFDVEMLYIAKKLGYKIKECPVQWFDSPHSKVNAVKDSYQMMIDLLKIRINDLRGFYS